MNIVIATIKSWNISNAMNFIEENKNRYNIKLVTDVKDLTVDFLKEYKPDYVFFPHWSNKIKPDIFENYNCIVFHTSNLPEGRGGSPIQNQIVRKIYDSNICAIKVVDKYDEGDIYLKESISLREGSIDEILTKISNIIFKEMIPRIIEKKITPIPQTGEVSYFERRKYEMSNLLNAGIVDEIDLYDYVRMLDGEGYPKAYFKIGKCTIQFSDINYKNGELIGRFEVNEE